MTEELIQNKLSKIKGWTDYVNSGVPDTSKPTLASVSASASASASPLHMTAFSNSFSVRPAEDTEQITDQSEPLISISYYTSESGFGQGTATASTRTLGSTLTTSSESSQMKTKSFWAENQSSQRPSLFGSLWSGSLLTEEGYSETGMG